MSRKPRDYVPVFAALGERTRLALITKLSGGGVHSISQLSEGSALSRQAVTKHLRVLERAGVVRCAPSGRERRFQLDPAPINDLRGYLDRISGQWDQALSRLRTLVED